MADEPAKTPIQNKYAQSYADDLAANRREQSEVTAQIAGLQERLDQLKAEEAWLARAQGSLPGAVSSAPEAQPATGAAEAPQGAAAEQADTSAPAEEAADAAQTVPQQRRDQPVEEAQPEQPARKAAAAKKTAPAKKTTGRKTAEKATTRTTAKKASAEPVKKAAARKTSAEPAKKTAASKKATAKKTAEKAPAQQAAAAPAPAGRAAAEEKSGPPLWQLILDILRTAPGQPYVAREVHDELAQHHPSRKTSAQTVRNNLQTLVKKGLAEKSRQQGSVMYTAYADTEAETAPAADGEAGQAPEGAAEKVPAEA
ncbi:BlaI/MecI/CopY family transcriptional regulator [Streptomyces cellostaticus]|uniref:BlaI/MecI/CopY family transcriptional regulator n=1 Tax=Streptomyces cellostaticus TaxID=67285 RepID=UPI0020263F64|nr:BlaI/MecI/CopY family transcriptional regulator [Streptomyces cellostaticus]